MWEKGVRPKGQEKQIKEGKKMGIHGVLLVVHAAKVGWIRLALCGHWDRIWHWGLCSFLVRDLAGACPLLLLLL